MVRVAILQYCSSLSIRHELNDGTSKMSFISVGRHWNLKAAANLSWGLCDLKICSFSSPGPSLRGGYTTRFKFPPIHYLQWGHNVFETRLNEFKTSLSVSFSQMDYSDGSGLAEATPSPTDIKLFPDYLDTNNTRSPLPNTLGERTTTTTIIRTIPSSLRSVNTSGTSSPGSPDRHHCSSTTASEGAHVLVEVQYSKLNTYVCSTVEELQFGASS